MSERSGVSVVIPTYNRAEQVLDAVSSALSQAWSPLEVIVVDDASTDDTVARLESLAAGQPRLRVIARARNSGKSIARNLGILAAEHEYVALLDSDNCFAEGKLERQMPQLRSAGDLAVGFSGYTLVSDGHREAVILDGWREQAPAALAALLHACCVNTSTVVARRQLLIEAGLFRADLTHCEDHDLWLRLALTGHEFVYTPEPLTAYRMHAGSASADEALVARYAELVIGDFFARGDLPPELVADRRRWLSRWALASAGRYLAAGRGYDAFTAIGRAALHRPGAVRPGWAAIAWRALELMATGASRELLAAAARRL